jgi:hypothetical protein
MSYGKRYAITSLLWAFMPISWQQTHSIPISSRDLPLQTQIFSLRFVALEMSRKKRLGPTIEKKYGKAKGCDVSKITKKIHST